MMRFARMPASGPGAAAPSSLPSAADAEPAPALCAPGVPAPPGASVRFGLLAQAPRANAAAITTIRTVRRIQSLPFSAATGHKASLLRESPPHEFSELTQV